MRDRLVARIRDHHAERLAARIARDHDRVPRLTVLGDECLARDAGVGDLGADLREKRSDRARVLLVLLASALGEPQEVDHHDLTWLAVVEEPPQVRTPRIDRHPSSLDETSRASPRERLDHAATSRAWMLRSSDHRARSC